VIVTRPSGELALEPGDPVRVRCSGSPGGRCWPTGSATSLFGLAAKPFVVACVVGFTGPPVTSIVASMVVAAFLAPSIVPATP
jgi:hypothetical protein